MEEKTIITSSTASERPLETLSRAGERIIPITILSSRQEQINHRTGGFGCAIKHNPILGLLKLSARK